MKLQSIFLLAFCFATLFTQAQDYNDLISKAKAQKDSTKVLQYFFDKNDKNLDTAGFNKVQLNNTVYYWVFKYSNSTKTQLKKAARYMKIVTSNELKLTGGKGDIAASYFDTYANVLYRLGKTKEAIKWQEKSKDATPTPNIETLESLNKMKRGERTW